jgi:predicted O-methyltransferase YrrM
MDIVHPDVEAYMAALASVDDDPVLLEMESLAKERGFPIIGRLCGRMLEVFARGSGAKRIFEMGSGFGYSAYWFSRATGPDGEIHLTDTDEDNGKKAMDFLRRADLDAPVEFHVSDAFEAFEGTSGDFDIVYCDIDKHAYPQAWELAKQRIRVGGLFMCDNVLWSGRVTGKVSGDVREGYTEAIMNMNQAIATDRNWRSTIVPLRDGVVAAVRIA